MRIAVLGAGLMVLVAMAARAEGVKLRPKLVAGQVARYDIQGQFGTSRGEGADTRTLVQRARMRLTVAAVAGDGTATVRGAFERISEEIQAPGAEGEQAEWAPGMPAAGEGKAGLAQTVSQLGGCILEFQVMPDGTVGKLTGLDPAVDAARAWVGARAPTVLGVFTSEAAAGMLFSVFAVDPSGGERSVGSSWTVNRRLPVLEGAAAVARTRYTLKRVSDGVGEIAGDSVYEIAVGAAEPSEPKVAISDQSGKVLAKWDTSAGRLVSRVEESRVTWTTSLAVEKPIMAKATMSSKVTITLVEGEAPKPAGPK